MMQQLGQDLEEATGVLSFKRPLPSPRILDMCMAPGGFMAAALRFNPDATATTFSLPVDMGGHAVLLPDNINIRHNFLDITMLAADMGMADIPTEHPEAKDFITQKKIRDGDLFDLVICDGQVLRTHKRSEAREKREAARLGTTQLALGLEHLQPGGRMVVLLHKVEMWSTVCVLRTFSRFARVRLYKPKRKWATRSSFYMIATDIQSRHESALAAVESYKLHWRVATFGTEEECQEFRLQKTRKEEVERTLEEFGTQLIRHGTAIWETQAKALENAPYVRGQPAQG